MTQKENELPPKNHSKTMQKPTGGRYCLDPIPIKPKQPKNEWFNQFPRTKKKELPPKNHPKTNSSTQLSIPEPNHTQTIQKTNN